MIIPRPYQSSDISRIRAAFAKHRRVLYVACCGSGKTVIFSQIAQGAVSKNKMVSVLAHRRELIMQCSDKLDQFEVEHGIIKAGIEPHFERNIQVASVQTLIGAVERITPNLIIPDEAHHSQNDTQQKIITTFPKARLLGVTASPIFGNGQGLGGYYDVLVQGPQYHELVAEGYLAPTRVFAPPFDGDMENEATQRKITGDAVEHYSSLTPGWPALVSCVSIKHAHEVAEAFQRAGYRFYAVSSKTDDDVRDGLIAAYKRGEVDGLCACDLFNEGTDLPRCRVMIKLRPTQSMGLDIQLNGRPVRPVYAPGFDLLTRDGRLAAIAASEKPYAVILDHVNNVFFHGLPDDHIDWSLTEAPVRYRQGGKLVPIRQCPKCYHHFAPAELCPHCGYALPVKSRNIMYTEGQLVEINKLEREKKKKLEEAEAKQRSSQRKGAKTLEELIEIGKIRGYKNPEFWANKVIEGRKKDGNNKPKEGR